MDNHYIFFASTVFVEGRFFTLRGITREAAALAVPIRCNLGKALIGDGGVIWVALVYLVGVVAITNFQGFDSSWNSHFCRVALAPRNIVYVPRFAFALGANVDVVTVIIAFAITTARTAVVGRGAFANVFQASHVRKVEPS